MRMIVRLLLLAAIISGTSLQATASNILPDKVDPDTFNIMTLPWVRSVESYRSTTTDMKTDKDGNLYVCGYFENWVNFGNGQILAEGDNHNANDIFLAKYDALGNLLWVQTAGSKEDDKALSMALSGDNVYITGYFGHVCYFGEDEMLLTKDRQNMYLANYDRDGNLKWVRQPESDGILRGLGLAADSEGSAYVTGNFRKELTAGDYTISSQMEKNSYLVKYDSSGKVSWLKQFSGGTSLITYLYVYDIACDHNDNIIVAGEMMGKVRFDNITYTTHSEYMREGALPRRETFMAKYHPNGTVKWMKSAGLECNFGDLTIGPDNDIIMTGYFKGTLDGNKKGQAKFEDKYVETHYDLFGDNTEDVYVVRFNENGGLKWVKAFGGRGQDRGNAITTDADGNIYVTGFFTQKMEYGDTTMTAKKYRTEEKDVFTASILADGTLKWIARAGSSKEDMGRCITADRHTNVYVGGSYEGNANFGQNWVSSKTYKTGFIAKYHAQPRQ